MAKNRSNTIKSKALLADLLSGRIIDSSRIDDLLSPVLFKEDTYLDYKSGKTDDAQELRRDVTSFANSEGGVLAIGIDENTYQVDGIDKRGAHSPQEWARSILHSLASQFSPSVIFQEVIHTSGKTVLLIAVGRNPTLIPLLEKDKPGPTYYLRSGDSTFAAPDYLMADLLLGRRQRPVISVFLKDQRPLVRQQSFSDKPLLSNPGGSYFPYDFGDFASIIRVENCGLSWIDEQRCGVVGYSFGRKAGIRVTGAPPLLSITAELSRYIELCEPDGLDHSGEQVIGPEIFHADISGTGNSSPSIHPFGNSSYKLDGCILPLRQWDMKMALYVVSRSAQPEWFQIAWSYRRENGGFKEAATIERCNDRPFVDFKLLRETK